MFLFCNFIHIFAKSTCEFENKASVSKKKIIDNTLKFPMCRVKKCLKSFDRHGTPYIYVRPQQSLEHCTHTSAYCTFKNCN